MLVDLHTLMNRVPQRMVREADERAVGEVVIHRRILLGCCPPTRTAPSTSHRFRDDLMRRQASALTIFSVLARPREQVALMNPGACEVKQYRSPTVRLADY
ncbi:hypothetical protein [Geodermatophilus sp. SYSU D01176]